MQEFARQGRAGMNGWEKESYWDFEKAGRYAGQRVHFSLDA